MFKASVRILTSLNKKESEVSCSKRRAVRMFTSLIKS